MNRTYSATSLVAALITTVIIVVLAPVLASGEDGSGSQDVNISASLNTTLIQDTIAAMPVTPLNESEQDGVLYMREEEKLARDVYLLLYEKEGLPIFQNIAGSEQTHMDSLKILIDRYDLEDPAREEVGIFSNQEIQALYNNLTETGILSLEDALRTGATIEELDISDLQTYIVGTDNEDVKLVYEALMRGSRNHLRSYFRMLELRGWDYSPQYLSQEELDQIVGSPMERGPYIF